MLHQSLRLVIHSLLLCSGMLLIQSPSYAQSDESRVARIQSVLILRLIKFVDWPPDVLAASEDLHICTWGDSATEYSLRSIPTQKIREHEIRVRKLGYVLDTRNCHVLYISSSIRDVTPALLYSSGSRSLLTVSDIPDFTKRGGIIGLVRRDNRISFEIQLRYAREHGLQIGAPLLDLAKVLE